MEGFAEQDLVSHVRIYHRLNHGKCRPNRYKLPNMEQECTPNECTQQSTPTLEYFLQGLKQLLNFYPEQFQLGTHDFPDELPEQLIF